MLTRLRNHLARPLVAEMRLTLASMARSLSQADAEIVTLTAELRMEHIANSELIDRLHALDAQLAALTPKPRGVVREDRRLDIIRAVAEYESAGHAPTAMSIAARVHYEGGSTDNPASIARWVSDVAAEGWIIGRACKPMTYRVTDQGRACLDGGAVVAVAS